MRPEEYGVMVADDQTKKMVPVYKVNVSGEHSNIYCRNIEEVTALVKEFLDEDSHLEEMQSDEDFCWQFDIVTVFISEAELNALEPFER